MPNPVIHFEITGQDGAALQQFYRDAFGWSVDADNPMEYGMVDAAGRGIAGGVSGDSDGHHVRVYIEVADLAATLAEVGRRGGKTVMEPTEIPGFVTMAQFADPAGNVIGLVKAQ